MAEKSKLYVFDLDGTLANIDHRLHFIKDGAKDWDGFFAACPQDAPVAWVIELAGLCAYGGNLLILSGRNERVREQTVQWLNQHYVPIAQLLMRPEKDFRPDEVLKLEMLRDYLAQRPDLELVFIVDDRQRVVDMWRREGFNVLQCQAWQEESVHA